MGCQAERAWTFQSGDAFTFFPEGRKLDGWVVKQSFEKPKEKGEGTQNWVGKHFN